MISQEGAISMLQKMVGIMNTRQRKLFQIKLMPHFSGYRQWIIPAAVDSTLFRNSLNRPMQVIIQQSGK